MYVPSSLGTGSADPLFNRTHVAVLLAAGAVILFSGIRFEDYDELGSVVATLRQFIPSLRIWGTEPGHSDAAAFFVAFLYLSVPLQILAVAANRSARENLHRMWSAQHTAKLLAQLIATPLIWALLFFPVTLFNPVDETVCTIGCVNSSRTSLWLIGSLFSFGISLFPVYGAWLLFYILRIRISEARG